MDQSAAMFCTALFAPRRMIEITQEREEYFRAIKALGLSEQQAEDALQASADEAATTPRSIYAIARNRLIEGCLND